MKRSRLQLFWILIVVCIAFDQWIKFWARTNLNIGESWRGGPWHGVFEFTLTYNKGIAFGMFQGTALLMAPIALLMSGYAIYTVYKSPNETKWSTAALGFLAAGALGNLIDRVANPRGVTDMFLVRLSNITGGKLNDFPVFNIADSCITVAMVMLVIAWSRQASDAKDEPEPEPILKTEESSL
ncbi:MAG TPA: signal peptidase II [Fimbriimonas sp.]|nr:signal peptidase II [Fimbriimonas sp.]